MLVTFLGATHEVTGSCTLIETMGKNILVDCGMEQGADIFVNQDIPVNPADIDLVLLTHAHIDHSGKLPLLCKNGFKGEIYATEETVNLCKIMLMDSAHIQEFEAQWRNRKGKRSGLPPYEPMYTTADAAAALEDMHPVPYSETRQILENVSVRFIDAGHLLGSASIEIWITENDVTKKIVFSGDIGNINKPILKDPEYIKEADYVVMESTYGDRYHPDRVDPLPLLTDFLQRTLDRGGNVVIPSFAVGRTQEILYLIRQIKDEGLVKGHPHFPVYVDSPMANEATSVFLQSNPDCFDEETRAIYDKGINPIMFPDLKVSVSSDESRAINDDPTPKVIISASGMCEAGRIRHHLKHNLWRKDSLILFVGYQAVGTLGRTLMEGAESVKLFGETIAVEAEIASIPGISGHADKKGLLKWVNSFDPKPSMVFINHGEEESCESFGACLREEHGFNVTVPYSGTSFDLLTGQPVALTTGIRIQKKVHTDKGHRDARVQKAFSRLLSACERLLHIATKSDGLPNKDLARFADDVNKLCDKWNQ